MCFSSFFFDPKDQFSDEFTVYIFFGIPYFNLKDAFCLNKYNINHFKQVVPDYNETVWYYCLFSN